MRAVKAFHVAEAPPCQLQRVTALAAAQVENPVLRRKVKDAADEIHLAFGYLRVVHHVPVRLEIQVIEEPAPPIRGNVLFQVEYRAQWLHSGPYVLALLMDFSWRLSFFHCCQSFPPRATVTPISLNRLRVSGNHKPSIAAEDPAGNLQKKRERLSHHKTPLRSL